MSVKQYNYRIIAEWWRRKDGVIAEWLPRVKYITKFFLSALEDINFSIPSLPLLIESWIFQGLLVGIL